MSRVYIAGVGMTKLGKFPTLSVTDLVQKAVLAALADAGLELKAVEAAWFANSRQGQMEGQNSVRGQCALRSMGWQSNAIVNVENACAGGSTAFNQAMVSILAGQYDIVIAVGADKLFYPEKKEAMFNAFRGGADVHLVEETFERLTSLGASIVPSDIVSDIDINATGRSFFMDIYAGIARQHMAQFGTTPEQIAASSAKNHSHALTNPYAQYHMPMSVDDVLADAPVVWPLTRAMCAPIGDGAAAVVLVSEKAAKQLGSGRLIDIAASVIVSSSDREPGDYDQHAGRLAAYKAYERAGVGPSEMNVAEVHDATSFAEILQIENLGLCARGEGGPATQAGETTLGGRIPVNVSGGLVSKGHPIGATGLIMIHDIVMQLRGEAGRGQVEGARFGIVENGGGFWGVEEAATAVHILGPAAS
ncbi:thiolase family protein [Sphingomonas sp. CL5.1]|uniref:thiolase family protein n=1 Tax=Sphingomonas sp. CL5.1 TaxID=2653203 RepID=UPI0015831EF9|nr:thiolase family protein [Sphingomonas sp. CL5.1]QKS00618.1 thiolase family protein [Sphingomonas sp. CL5.1]